MGLPELNGIQNHGLRVHINETLRSLYYGVVSQRPLTNAAFTVSVSDCEMSIYGVIDEGFH